MGINKTVLIIVIMMMIAGCDGFYYRPVTEYRAAAVGGEFGGIALDGVGEIAVYLNRGHKVIVTADVDVIGHVTTIIDEMNILRVGLTGGARVDGKGPINIEIHMPRLSSVELAGHGNITIVSGNIGGGMSKSKAGADTQSRLFVAHSGVGDIDARNCAAHAVSVKHSGRGRVAVTAVSVLNVDITTNNGEVVYGGDPIVRIPADNTQIPEYDAAFNNVLWVTDDGGDARIKRDPDQPPDLPLPQYVRDPRDGQIYPTIKVGYNIWVAKNLNYAIVDNDTDSSWCNGGDPSSCNIYGRLYNWNAAASVCGGLGDGWRLPALADWDDLVTAAGGVETAGAVLKSSARWESYEDIVNRDELNFSALPGGYRENTSGFIAPGADGLWWTSAEHEEESRLAYSRWMKHYTNEALLSFSLKEYGFSVRCVKMF